MKKPTRRKALVSISRKIKACEKRIAAERDKLRVLIDDARAIESSCDEAIDDLVSAADSLSRYL